MCCDAAAGTARLGQFQQLAAQLGTNVAEFLRGGVDAPLRSDGARVRRRDADRTAAVVPVRTVATARFGGIERLVGAPNQGGNVLAVAGFRHPTTDGGLQLNPFATDRVTLDKLANPLR